MLEIETGSGYQSVVVSLLCREVVTIERFRSLAETAENRFVKLGSSNITQQIGDGAGGMPDYAPDDRIAEHGDGSVTLVSWGFEKLYTGLCVAPVVPEEVVRMKEKKDAPARLFANGARLVR